MAVPVQTPYQEYTANGVATSFAVAFQCLSKDTLIVTINGVEQSPTLWNLTGGNVVFVAAPANLAIVGIERSTALTREVTYQTYDNSLRPDVLNNDIDRLWHVLQENKYIYNQKVNKVTQIQTTGNLQGGGSINDGLTLSLKDQTVTADYAFGSSVKIPVITLNQDGTVKSLSDVDLQGTEGGIFYIPWISVTNTPTTLNGYGITDAYTKTEANAAFIEDQERGNAFGVAELDGNSLLYRSNLPSATTSAIGAVKLDNTLTSTATDKALTAAQGKVLNDQAFGINQSWSDVTSTRLFGTTYTNTTLKPIYIYVLVGTAVTSGSFSILFDDSLNTGVIPFDYSTVVTLKINPGGSYKFTNNGNAVLSKVLENK